MLLLLFRAVFTRPGDRAPSPRRTPSLPVVILAVLACLHARDATPQPAPALTLGEALALQGRHHETLQAADALLRQREDERAAAHSLYYPRVEAQLRATRIDAPIEIDLDPIRQVILGLHPQVPAGRVPSFRTIVQDDAFWKADVRATWPIFTGGRIPAANAAAQARVDEARTERRQAEAALTVELIRRYFAVRLAEAVAAVRGEVVDGLKRHAFDARRLEEEGLTARVERLAADVAVAEAERLQRRARDEASLARIALAGSLPPGSPPDPVTPLFIVGDLPPVEDFAERARQAHPVLARLETQSRLATQAVRAEDAGRWPEVFAFRLRELHEGDLTILEPAWAVGLGAHWTLFDGGARARRTAAARAQLARVAALDARARRDLGTLVESKYRTLTRARDQFDTLQATLALVEENLRVRTRAFEEGMATSLEIVDARLALARVRLERLAAAYDFDVAMAELLDASGQVERYEEFRGHPTRLDVEP